MTRKSIIQHLLRSSYEGLLQHQDTIPQETYQDHNDRDNSHHQAGEEATLQESEQASQESAIPGPVLNGSTTLPSQEDVMDLDSSLTVMSNMIASSESMSSTVSRHRNTAASTMPGSTSGLSDSMAAIHVSQDHSRLISAHRAPAGSSTRATDDSPAGNETSNDGVASCANAPDAQATTSTKALPDSDFDSSVSISANPTDGGISSTASSSTASTQTLPSAQSSLNTLGARTASLGYMPSSGSHIGIASSLVPSNTFNNVSSNQTATTGPAAAAGPSIPPMNSFGALFESRISMKPAIIDMRMTWTSRVKAGHSGFYLHIPKNPWHLPLETDATLIYSFYETYKLLLANYRHHNILPRTAIELGGRGVTFRALASMIKDPTPENKSLLVTLLRPGPSPAPSSILPSMKMTELRLVAKSLGLKPYTARRKTDLVSQIKTHFQIFQQSQPFRLLCLAPELRLIIFGYVLAERRDLCTSYPPLCAQPALTKVSKTIRAETLPLFYGMNRVSLRVGPPEFEHRVGVKLSGATSRFMKAIGNNVGFVRKVNIEVSIGSRMVVVKLDLKGKRPKSGTGLEHGTVERTCGSHQPGNVRCRRWEGSKTIKTVWAKAKEEVGPTKTKRKVNLESEFEKMIEELVGGDDGNGEEVFDSEGLKKFVLNVGNRVLTYRDFAP